MKLLKKTKIVATVGPASSDEETLRRLMEEGVNVIRLNFSHGDHQSHGEIIDRVKKIRKELKLPVAIMLDTKGPEIRIGTFETDEGIRLEPGDRFVLTTKEVIGDKSIVSVTYKNLPQDVYEWDHILIDDGLVELIVREVREDQVITEVVNGGTLTHRKGVNIPGAKIQLPSLTEKDKEDIRFGVEKEVDFIAASFIRKGSDVVNIRRVLEEAGDFDMRIIAKIENREGVDNQEEIIEAADGIMVARGDLGVEIQTEEIPLVQKELIRRCVDRGKPVITATQMLDSMMRNPRPTRAEVTDVANAIFDGTTAIMLSGETASGKYPVEAVQTMVRIARRTEDSLDYEGILMEESARHSDSTTNSIGKSTCFIAKELGASAIIAATSSGYTSRAISKFKPKTPIVAATTSEKVCRQLALDWGVYGIIADYEETADSVIEESAAKAMEAGYVEEGDLVVLTAGLPVGLSGSTNMIKVHTMAKVLGKGTGIGNRAVVGRACVLGHGENGAEKFREGDILVVHGSDREMIPYLAKASGIVAEEGGLTSSSAIVALNLELPGIVGVTDATVKIPDGQWITLDTEGGKIYLGNATVR